MDALNDDSLLTVQEVARALRVSEATLNKARISKKGAGPPFIKVGQLVRYRKSALDIWLKSREQER